MKTFTVYLVFASAILALSACSPVNFASEEDNGGAQGAGGPGGGGPGGPGPGPDPCVGDDCEDRRKPQPVTGSVTVTAGVNAADILFVIDNSGSMQVQIQQLANRFPNFITSLGNLDWNICVTTTDLDDEDGKLRRFPSGVTVLNKNVPNYEQEFLGLMGNMGKGSGDERGIYAINRALDRDEGCFRDGATFNTVVISDEDERSQGASNPNGQQYRPLQARDFPNSVFDTMAAKGWAKVYTHSSIIIRPATPELGVMADDVSCRMNQAAEGHPAWFGTYYAELSVKTKGILGSVCASDYGMQLSFIGNNIVNTLASVPLECEPVDAAGNKITSASQILAPPIPASTATLNGNKIDFSPALTGGTVVNLSYHCLR